MLVACQGVEPRKKSLISQAAYNMGSLGGQASALSIGIWAPRGFMPPCPVPPDSGQPACRTPRAVSFPLAR